MSVEAWFFSLLRPLAFRLTTLSVRFSSSFRLVMKTGDEGRPLLVVFAYFIFPSVIPSVFTLDSSELFMFVQRPRLFPFDNRVFVLLLEFAAFAGFLCPSHICVPLGSLLSWVFVFLQAVAHYFQVFASLLFFLSSADLLINFSPILRVAVHKI